MLIADSHEFIELYRGARDLRMGMELVRLRDDIRFVSFAPDVLSPADRSIRGVRTLAEAGIPALPERMELVTLPSVPVLFRRKDVGGIFSLMRGYGRALQRLRPDVIIENPYVWLTPRNYTTHRVARRLGVPVIWYDPGDDAPITPQQRLMLPFERPVVRDVHAIVTFNGAGKRRFMTKYGYPGERIHVIPKPVDVAEWRPPLDPAEVRAGLGIPAGAFVVGFSGRLTRIKAPRRLLEAARRALDDPAMAGVVFLFIGGAFGTSTEDESEYRLPNTVVTGMRPNDELPRLLAAVDVMAFPDVSQPGGFSTSIAEAMAAGLPMILGAGAGQDFVPVVDGESAVIIEPSDADALYAAIRALKDEPARRLAMGEAVGRYARERMDYRRVAEAYLALFEAAIRRD